MFNILIDEFHERQIRKRQQVYGTIKEIEKYEKVADDYFSSKPKSEYFELFKKMICEMPDDDLRVLIEMKKGVSFAWGNVDITDETQAVNYELKEILRTRRNKG